MKKETRILNNKDKGTYASDESAEKIEAMNRKNDIVVKWYKINMSYEDKARFGLLTYAEFLQWQAELQQKAMEEANGAGTEGNGIVAHAGNTEGAKSDDGRETFWAADGEDRANVSGDDYADFLSRNQIDVSNKSSVDFEALSKEINKGSEEPSMDEILASINKANHQGDDILTEAEIAALFAAANA